jgi:hypothetical protein
MTGIKMRDISMQMLAAAYHEAGHAVVRLALDERFNSVWIAGGSPRPSG